MAFSLRLPPALDESVRIRAEQLGVPLNALICFALDHYMRGGMSPASPLPFVDELDTLNPTRVSHGGMPLKVKTAAGYAAKLGRPLSRDELAMNGVKAPLMPSKPPLMPLPSKPSKAERRAFTDASRSARKLGL